MNKKWQSSRNTGVKTTPNMRDHSVQKELLHWAKRLVVKFDKDVTVGFFGAPPVQRRPLLL
ncbi:hypothetical protein [uncultured Tateyamaria sp.]|uniref:hypothetical protein n=1 Tax=uncultured Tateyamaria sp. TaxID=455651 RepID=UPI00261DF437|nr:hypothetical protein [uncultured Tateyamaria sp.]